ncbi:uncharacterized protein G2W53_033063 [Senna tora]|uniref:Uncharacterized protein n=1 Tax=Senna tora TaxID=362788 RepID=A0A834T1I3_9FABA|nr:uncharacterized protein G2W53_033063 [Senna tora]
MPCISSFTFPSSQPSSIASTTKLSSDSYFTWSSPSTPAAVVNHLRSPENFHT